MNSIEIRKSNIDYDKIIKLALQKKEWGKTYTLMTNGSVTVTCKMRLFNFDRSYAEFKVKVEYLHDDKNYSDYNFAEYFINNFDKETFKSIIEKKIITCCESVINTINYQNFKNTTSKTKYYAMDITEKMLIDEGYNDIDTINNISNDSVRKVALDELKEELKESLNYVYNHTESSYLYNHINDFTELNQTISELKSDKE